MPETPNGYPVLGSSADAVPLRFITGRVAPFAREIFEAFCARFAAEVEPIDRAQSWGYARRPVAGTGTWSEHAAGTAIDLNATDHPQYRTTYTPAKRQRLLLLLADFPRIEWGGLWPAARLDEMHFEIRQEAPMSKMVSPLKGYATSEYGWRTLAGRRVFHGGLDIATGGVAAPVYAAFDGVFEKIVRSREHGQTNNVGTIAPYRTGNAPLIRNADGERQLYGHVMTAIGWRVGDKIKAGQLIGYTDLSGNTSGYHCHLEVWNADRTTRNPRLDFRAFGIGVGSTPVRASSPGSSRYPWVAMTRNSSWSDLSYAYGILLGALGYEGTRGERIQSWLNDVDDAGLVVDGNIGPRSIEAWQRYFRALTRKGKLRHGVTVITRRIGGLGSEFRTAIAAYANDHRNTAKKG